MARIRSIKPEYCTSEAINQLTIACELHFAKLWTYCDDEGRGLNNPKLIKAACWPLRDSISVVACASMQEELYQLGRIVCYEVGGKSYFEVVNWAEHQKPQHPKPSEIPPPDQGIPEPLPTAQAVDIAVRDKPHEASSQTLHGEGGVVGGGEGDGAGGLKPSSTALQIDVLEASFEEFWSAYPVQPNGKKPERAKAWAQFKRLSDRDRALALTGVVHYRAACDQGTYAKHAFRWLRDKTWVDWQTPARPPASRDRFRDMTASLNDRVGQIQGGDDEQASARAGQARRSLPAS